MTLYRWDPQREITNFQKRMHELVTSVCGMEGPLSRRDFWCPHVDVIETLDAYIFRVELPGVGRENINIETRGNQLLISGTRPMTAMREVHKYHSSECTHGDFARSFTIPAFIDAEKAQGKYIDGILEITIPKSTENHSRSITVVSVE